MKVAHFKSLMVVSILGTVLMGCPKAGLRSVTQDSTTPTDSGAAAAAAVATTCGVGTTFKDIYTSSVSGEWASVSNMVADAKGNFYVARSVYNSKSMGYDAYLTQVSDCGATVKDIYSVVYDGKIVTTIMNFFSALYLDASDNLYVTLNIGNTASGASADLTTKIGLFQAGTLVASVGLKNKSESFGKFASDGKTIYYFNNYNDGMGTFQAGIYKVIFDGKALGATLITNFTDKGAAGANGTFPMDVYYDSKRAEFLIAGMAYDTSGKCSSACDYAFLYGTSDFKTVNPYVSGRASRNTNAYNYYNTPFVFVNQDAAGNYVMAYPVFSGKVVTANLDVSSDLKVWSSTQLGDLTTQNYLTGLLISNKETLVSFFQYDGKSVGKVSIYNTSDYKTINQWDLETASTNYVERWGMIKVNDFIASFGMTMDKDGMTSINSVRWRSAP